MRPYLKILLILSIPLAMLAGYALSPAEFGSGDWVLEKADLSLFEGWFSSRSDSDDKWVEAPDTHVVELEDSVATPAVEITLDSVVAEAETPRPSQPIVVAPSDSSRFHVMIFGDSMLEGLGRRLGDYTTESDYDLTSIIWYSSSTELWAETDTLEFFLDRVRPDYVLLCLGSNELFVRDLAKREKYIGRIVQKLGNRPFCWISPPNWKPDSGINDLIIGQVGRGRYFDSRSLELERASDKVHPTRSAAAYWMDTIVSWLNSPAASNPLPLIAPTGQRPRKFHQYVLYPVR